MNIHKHSSMYAAGAVISAILISMFVYELELPSWVNMASYISLFGIQIFALRDWRAKAHDGFMTYGNSMGYSSMYALYYCAMMAIWTFVFFSYIGPDMLQKMKDKGIADQMKVFKQYHIPEDQWSASLAYMDKIFNPGVQAVLALVGGMIFLTIINLIISAFMKKDDPSFNTFDPDQNPFAQQ